MAINEIKFEIYKQLAAQNVSQVSRYISDKGWTEIIIPVERYLFMVLGQPQRLIADNFKELNRFGRIQ